MNFGPGQDKQCIDFHSDDSREYHKGQRYQKGMTTLLLRVTARLEELFCRHKNPKEANKTQKTGSNPQKKTDQANPSPIQEHYGQSYLDP